MKKHRVGWIADYPKLGSVDDVRLWALETIGEELPGCITSELDEAYMDHFEGEWQFTIDENFEPVFWTWRRDHCMLYSLRWL